MRIDPAATALPQDRRGHLGCPRAAGAADPRVHPTPSGWEMTPPLGRNKQLESFDNENNKDI